MTTSDADRQVRALLDELLALADNGTRTATSDAVLALGHAWFFGCVDKLTAALALSDLGLTQAAAPLVRSALEHALGMVWLNELGHDAVEGTVRSQVRWAKNVQKATAAANANEAAPGRMDWSPELEAVLVEVAGQEVSGAKVLGEWRLDDRFRAAKAFDLYVAWLSETASSHATQASAAPYVVVGTDRFLIIARPAIGPGDLFLRCGAIAVVAFRAMAEALDADIWKARVEALGERLAGAMLAARATSDVAGPEDDDWLSRFD